MGLTAILRHTRTSTNVSQLDLALRLGVSQRHISFLETGRSQPSREMLLAWMQELRVPESIRNAALLLGGFGNLDAAANSELALPPAAALSALTRLAQVHDPFPSIIFSADWRVVSLSPGSRWLCDMLMPAFCAGLGGTLEGFDMLEAVGHEEGLLSKASDPASLSAGLLTQLQAEAWVMPSLQLRVRKLSETLERRYGPLLSNGVQGLATPGMAPCFDTAAGQLSFHTFQSAFGIPQDINPSALRIELWFPADEYTRKLAGGATRPYAEAGS